MRPHTLTVVLFLCLTLLFLSIDDAHGQRKAPTGGRLAIVVDERLAALRATPQLNGKLVRRLGRGRLVAITGIKTTSDGIAFYRVNLTTRTRGWIQRDSVVSASRPGDDHRLLGLIQTSTGFDRLVRCRIFLNHFRHSRLRPTVLLLLGDTAEALALKLTQSISRKLNPTQLSAPEFTYPQPPLSGSLQPPKHPLPLQPLNEASPLRRPRLPSPPPPPPQLTRSHRSPPAPH